MIAAVFLVVFLQRDDCLDGRQHGEPELAPMERHVLNPSIFSGAIGIGTALL